MKLFFYQILILEMLCSCLLASDFTNAIEFKVDEFKFTQSASCDASLFNISDPQADFAVRLKSVHLLSENLNSNDLHFLFSFLAASPSALETNRPALQFLKNEVMNRLLDQTQLPQGFDDLLIAMYRDQKQDQVTHDYAIQHLISVVERLEETQAQEKNKIKAALMEAAQAKTEDAGTALLGMHRLASLDPLFNREEIGRLALRLVMSEDAQLANKITALQICAEGNTTKALPEMRLLAQKTSPFSLRISAIAGIGTLGQAQDLSLLNGFFAECSTPLKPAIEAAIKQINHRLSPQDLAQNSNR